MDIELRKQALACVEMKISEVQVVIIVLTRQLAYKVVQQLNDDAGQEKCLPCVNDQRIEEQINEIIQKNFQIVVGTLGRVDLFFYRNALRPAYIKKLFLLDSIAMLSFPLKRSLERVLGFIQKHTHLTLHIPPSDFIIKQMQNFVETVSCYGIHPDLIEVNHFALHVTDELRKLDKLCDLCRVNTSIPILICCKMQGTAFANAKILRAQNLPVITVTSEMTPVDIHTAIETFQRHEVHIMITTGYIRGLLDLRTPMIIINYDLPKPDAYARRVNFTGESWIAKNTVFISLIKMSEIHRLYHLKEDLHLRWILVYPD